MKKVLATILALVMALSLCSVSWATDPAVAKIGNQEYATLEEAISAVKNNETIELMRDATPTGIAFWVKDCSATSFAIELGNNTINPGTGTVTAAIIVSGAKTVTIKGGKLGSTTATLGVALMDGATVKLENVEITGDNKGVQIDAEDGAPCTFEMVGGKVASANSGIVSYGAGNSITINGTEITSAEFGVQHNGSNAPVTVNIIGATIKDTSANGAGVYISGNATLTEKQSLTIENSHIEGSTAVETKFADVTISGDETELKATAATYSYVANGNGSCTSGVALAVTDNTDGKTGGTVKVTGGTFEGVKAIHHAENKGDNTTRATIELSGGNYSTDIKDFVASSVPVATTGSASAIKFHVGENAIVKAAETTKDITVVQGTSISGIPYGTKVTNGTNGEITVNGNTVRADSSTTITRPSTGGYYYAGPSISAVLNGPNKSATDYTSGDYGLIFRSTASYSSFTGVQVDGKTLAKSNYTVEDNGGTEVYLKATYLKTLAAGKHTVTILSTAGNVSMDFTIGGKTTAPQTFDAGIALYIGMALTSAAGVAFVGKKRED